MEKRRDDPAGGDFAEGEETLPRGEHVGSFADGEETLTRATGSARSPTGRTRTPTEARSLSG
jgi:hypothetical protein